MAMRNKYNNRKVSLDGFTFDSAAEARRYQELKLLQMDGQIERLKIHPRYRIEINGQFICTYVGDFEYVQKSNGRSLVVEDVKGYKTAVYKLKKKLMKAVHRIDILETKA